MKTLNLIGAGKLGQTLAHLWQLQGQFRIQQVLTRSEESAQRACDFINGTQINDNQINGDQAYNHSAQAVTSFEELQPADIWLLATPDGDIAQAAAQLHQRPDLISQDTILLHCSGTLNSNVLSSRGLDSRALNNSALTGTNSSGASVASIHPIHSFASPSESLNTFAGSYCGYEGETAALNTLLPAFTAIGAQLFAIDGEQKMLYHAASVIACNYLVGLMDASLECFEAAGVSRAQAQQLLFPITRQTLENVLTGSPQKALTGPISRGDINTVRHHLDAIQTQKPQLADIYKALGLQTAKVAAQQEPPADAQSLSAIKSLLSTPQNPL